MLLVPGLLVALGCGSTGESAQSTGSTGSLDEACEGYQLGDPCIDDANFTQCQEMAAQCPGAVAVMESCPLQFSCEGGGGGGTAGGDTADCDYDLADPCINEENLAQCQEMAAQCPGAVAVLESCPMQFSCN